MTLSNIKILQSLVQPTQFNDILDWNQTRNKLEFSYSLEYDMLKEEIQEYFTASALVDKLDAIADILFVGVGTVAKATYNFEVAPDFFEELDVILSDYAGRCVEEGMDISLVGPLISDGLAIVIEANKQKLANKNAEGKIIKPEGFVPPEEALGALIEATKLKEVPSAPDMSQVFSGQQ